MSTILTSNKESGAPMFGSRGPDTRQEVLIGRVDRGAGSPSRAGRPRGRKTWWVKDRTWEVYGPLFEGGIVGVARLQT